MKRLLVLSVPVIALVFALAACGDDDDDDDTAEPTEEGGDGTPEAVEGGSVTDESGDLLDLLSLVPASDIPTQIPADIEAAIDIQSASLAIEGGEIVLTMTLAGPVGNPGDFTRGYDFGFRSSAFVAAERGAYDLVTLIIGAERNAGAWSVIKKTGANDPVPLPTGTVTVEGSTVTIRVPLSEIIVDEFYEWRAIAWHNLSPEFTPADVAPNGPGFVQTPLPQAPESTVTAPTPTPTP
jgi:hypothetical protein